MFISIREEMVMMGLLVSKVLQAHKDLPVCKALLVQLAPRDPKENLAEMALLDLMDQLVNVVLLVHLVLRDLVDFL